MKSIASNARNLHRVLERQEDALAGALFGVHFKEVLTVIQDLSSGHLVNVAPCQNACQRALSGSVRPHDGVDLALVHREVNAFQNFLFRDSRV
jgi:hypothetical protein